MDMDKMDISSKLNFSLSEQYSYYAILNYDICAHILDLNLTMCFLFFPSGLLLEYEF